MLLRFLILLLVSVFPFSAKSVEAGKRIALVVGNSEYLETAPLVNPKHDATDFGKALRSLGFEVEVHLDLKKLEFDQALSRFGYRIEGAETALFFYAGHGIQVDGENYLIPVDAKLNRKRNLKRETISLNGVLEDMESASQVRLLFLDACRDNPLSRSLARSMSGSRSTVGKGLAAVGSDASGTMISYATAGGSVAADGSHRNSPYTTALLEHMGTRGLEVGLMLRKVTGSVKRATGGRQTPWAYGSLENEFYLAGREDKAAVMAPVVGQKMGGFGGISVASTPEKAAWKLNDEYMGLTPDKVESIAVGSYPIEISLDGYQSWSSQVRVREGRSTPVQVTLKPMVSRSSEQPQVSGESKQTPSAALYSFIVNSTPDDARIRILNIVPGYERGMKLEPKSYHIEVSKEGYHTKRRWVAIKDRDLVVSIALNRQGVEDRVDREQRYQPVERERRNRDRNRRLERLLQGKFGTIKPDKHYLKLGCWSQLREFLLHFRRLQKMRESVFVTRESFERNKPCIFSGPYSQGREARRSMRKIKERLRVPVRYISPNSE
ncbi:caspase family protein [Magnetococcales bacterium HHB-1]